MVNGILGKKLGMTQVFDEGGRMVPVTVIEAGPCFVTQIKTVKTDGYEGVQVAFGDVKESRLNRPEKGHLAKSGTTLKRHLLEVPFDEIGDVTLGQQIKSDIFTEGDIVKITGVSKGKGFAGVMKRHHFHGAEATHGSMLHRKPASGGATDAARTFKGSRRPGRMGGKQITLRGLTVYRVDAVRNLLLIKGAVPGANGGLIVIRRQMIGG
ncbi:MAG: 50S ribosomal protein L3 [Armatimonadetes bacterium]|nr:50S ribosomal protein L3 [Armatimonadota bacterium]